MRVHHESFDLRITPNPSASVVFGIALSQQSNYSEKLPLRSEINLTVNPLVLISRSSIDSTEIYKNFRFLTGQLENSTFASRFPDLAIWMDKLRALQSSKF